jgi:Holliday junction resolvase RusA-like endonuclease
MSDIDEDEVVTAPSRAVLNGTVIFKVDLEPVTKTCPMFKIFPKRKAPVVLNPSTGNERVFLHAAKAAIEMGYQNPQFAMFEKTDCLAIKVITRRPRPLAHYVDKIRESGILKPEFIHSFMTVAVGGDVDNYVKLVQDALQCSKVKKDGLFHNNSKIFFLCGVKVWDNEGDCKGGTTVSIEHVAAGEAGEAYIEHHFLGMR